MSLTVPYLALCALLKLQHANPDSALDQSPISLHILRQPSCVKHGWLLKHSYVICNTKHDSDPRLVRLHGQNQGKGLLFSTGESGSDLDRDTAGGKSDH